MVGKDREWLFDFGVAVLASPFIALEALVRLAARPVIAAVRSRRTSLDQVKGETEKLKALAEREEALALLRERERQNRPERPTDTKTEEGPPEEFEESGAFDDDLRARKKAELEAAYARVKQDEQERLAEDLPEDERREWENAYAQRRREIREEIRKWI